ncbi:MAG: glycosyltransferase family 2 protein [Ruminococcaceae bacterium]|nr:glycosyltransferase family 2 protein [Oscillospiraceae bacterium]
MNRLIIVVPCFNEEEALPITIPALSGVLNRLISGGKIAADSAVLYVNDGSRDKTWEVIAAAHEQDAHIFGLNLAGNVGHQNALLAGLEFAMPLCDMTVSIDADLQDDIDVIEEMVDKYIAGADVVFGVRNDRKKDSFFKRCTAQGFYKFMKILGTNTVYNHADYRLLSKRAMEALSMYQERNIFIRAVVAKMGFETDTVYYKRGERTAGKSKYPLKKMIAFAWDGITSFSNKPINMVTGLGIFIFVCSIIAAIYSLCAHFFGQTVSGWTSLILSIWFLGGLNLFAIGLVGQYVGKTYIETKQRPRYLIKESLTDQIEK